MRTITKRKGFTLVEAILASAILCMAVLALGGISTRSLSNSRLNRQYETAMSLVDKQLTMIDSIGIESFLESGETEGVFEKTEPSYYWNVASESLEADNLYEVKITVNWIDRNRPYSVSVNTRFNGMGLMLLARGD